MYRFKANASVEQSKYATSCRNTDTMSYVH